ncbi:MAG TPA: hypothetical protein PLM43_06190 [Candidatus Syntrophosphaera sp.]|mgnify:FL=1|nr:hypothetical protein [Candidatus Syntrophosphaera sp.]
MKAVQSFVMCIVLLFGAAVLTAQAPEWKWAVVSRGVFRVEGQSVALDSQGNQYVAGKFVDTAAFGSHNLT